MSTSVQVNAGVAAGVQLNGENVAILPVPYPALGVAVPAGTWRVRPGDLMVYSTDTQVGGLRYGVISLDPQPSNQDLEDAGPVPAGIRPYLSVPSSFKTLASLAQQLVAGDTSAIDRARAIQGWLGSSGQFAYSLKAKPITTAPGLATFLESTKRGYCQQFAVAMAVLARLVGIPSRVVVGYTSGTQKSGSWVVTTHDAHEWPELYFAGSGWLRFEPTPAGANGQGTATAPSYSKPQTPAGDGSGTDILPNGAVPSATATPPGLTAGQRADLSPTGEGGLGGSLARTSGGLTPWQIFGLVVAGLLAVAVIAPSAARLVIRRRRWGRARRGGDAALAHAAWLELQDDLVNYRGGYAPSESPRATGIRLGSERRLGSAGIEALSRITLAEERAQYAARPVSGELLRADSTQVRRALAATTSRTWRLRARMLPPSVLRYPWGLAAGVTRSG